jgi:FkbM family methyltransferase
MTNQMDAGLARLQRSGFSPAIVVDIGAHSGSWTRMALRYFPQAHFVMVEAQSAREPDLRNLQEIAPSRISYVVSLLGKEAKESSEFFLADTGSSLYVENTSFARQRVYLPMRTLNAVLQQHHAEGKIFLKLDVQGAELDVLAGASATLARTEAILLEVSIVQYNLGAPRHAEIVARLRQLDFQLFDVWDLRRIGPVLAQTDLIFVRRGSPLQLQAEEVIRSYGS